MFDSMSPRSVVFHIFLFCFSESILNYIFMDKLQIQTGRAESYVCLDQIPSLCHCLFHLFLTNIQDIQFPMKVRSWHDHAESITSCFEPRFTPEFVTAWRFAYLIIYSGFSLCKLFLTRAQLNAVVCIQFHCFTQNSAAWYDGSTMMVPPELPWWLRDYFTGPQDVAKQVFYFPFPLYQCAQPYSLLPGTKIV
jgi:hypothetical protein